MLFNSFQYWIFLPIVLLLYYGMPQRWRWPLLLAASYYFYMCWKVEYSLLLISSTVIDYYAGKIIYKAKSKRQKILGLGLSLCVNLGLLFFFKYYNFMAVEANTVLHHYNILQTFPSLRILLPVGISFYTFQTLSYTIDIYRGKRAPENHFGYFALYVSFFPQLVAGPIERSTHLLPELKKHIKFDTVYLVSGLRLVLWGMVKKVVVADNLAVVVNRIYENPDLYSGFPLALATVFFGFQIYCDFSGYSDIAIGSARMLGIDLMKNFNRPYIAKSISEFWQRWHISLSTWFRDYVYIPLGGKSKSNLVWFRNISITFVLSGIWHGANWTFLIWGMLHAFYYLVSVLTKNYRMQFDNYFSSPFLKRIISFRKVLLTFFLVQISWIFFRAETLTDAVLIITRVFTSFHLSDYSLSWCFGTTEKLQVLLGVSLIAFLEFVQHLMKENDANVAMGGVREKSRMVIYIVMLFLLVVFGRFDLNEFIYFQF